MVRDPAADGGSCPRRRGWVAEDHTARVASEVEVSEAAEALGVAEVLVAVVAGQVGKTEKLFRINT